MDLLSQIVARAKSNKQRIVLPCSPRQKKSVHFVQPIRLWLMTLQTSS